MNENPPSPREGGSDQAANHVPAGDDTSADTAPFHYEHDVDAGPMTTVSCDRCQRNEPVLHLTSMVDGRMRTFHLCRDCAAELKSETRAEADAGSEPFPWPPRAGEGVITAGGRTWREAMFAPASFYRRMPAAAPLGGALVYYLIVGVLASGIQLFWDMVGLVVLPRPAADSAWMMALPTSAGDALTSFFFAPLILIAGLFIVSAVTHVLLKLFGGASEHYGTTVRVFAYAQGPHLLVILPFIGVFIAMIWTVTISIIGLREAHSTTTAKAALALLLPAFGIGLLLLMFLFVVLMGAALLAS